MQIIVITLSGLELMVFRSFLLFASAIDGIQVVSWLIYLHPIIFTSEILAYWPMGAFVVLTIHILRELIVKEAILGDVRPPPVFYIVIL